MQKLESLGQLTGGVAHDFNNLLMAVLGNLDLLKKRMPADPKFLRLIDGAIQGAERGAILTKRMLAFARRQELKPEIVDVRTLVVGMTEMLLRSLGPTIEIQTRFSRDLSHCLVDPNQLELALLNLALNARDAMPVGGKLEISADCEAPPHGKAGSGAGGEFICLSVRDSGLGMDEATLKRATEPFFTTKGIGKGTGLGLSMVDGLAAQSGGTMRIVSQPAVGTTVKLWLPATALADDAVFRQTAPFAGKELPPCRVLVVDDDPIVAVGTVAMLEDLGHQAVDAESGQVALEMLSSAAEFDLVITDHAMPGMTGSQLAREIRAKWPSLPIILASGFAELPDDLEGSIPRLSKPYRQADLSRVIASLMVEPNPASSVLLSPVRARSA
jgi:CheY-like chemotaxis protein